MYNVHDRSIVTTQNVTADLDEDEMLMRAIAMSLEVEEEVEEREVDEEKLCFTRHHGPGELVKTNPMWLSVRHKTFQPAWPLLEMRRTRRRC